MEALTRLVADSLARHGLDRSVDPRRLQWSRWFRCDSPHSLLIVPSKPGIFALAEEIMDLGSGKNHVGTASPGGPAEQSSADFLGGAELQRCDPKPGLNPALAAEAATKRMLAVLQFSEDDDMAFTLDRMFTRINPMRARLATGRCFLRFVVIADRDQRRSICTALNQWLLASAEKATGIGADFSSSLELSMDRVGTGDSPEHAGSNTDRVGRTLLSANAEAITPPAQPIPSVAKAAFATTVPEASAPHLNFGAAKNLHCPQPLPSGF
jgi:hypothetical protein